MKKAVILPCISKKALFLSFLIVVLSAALATSPVFGGNDGEDKAEKARQKTYRETVGESERDRRWTGGET